MYGNFEIINHILIWYKTEVFSWIILYWILWDREMGIIETKQWSWPYQPKSWPSSPKPHCIGWDVVEDNKMSITLYWLTRLVAMPHWFGRLMVALRHLEFGFHLTSANLNLEPPYLNHDPMSLTGALLVSHVSFIPMALPFPCLSYSHVSLIPVSHPFLCLTHSYFSPIPVSISFSCLTHSHSRVSPIPMSLSFSCLSHSHVSLSLMSLPFLFLSHTQDSLILMPLSFSCLSGSNITLILISLLFCSVLLCLSLQL